MTDARKPLTWGDVKRAAERDHVPDDCPVLVDMLDGMDFNFAEANYTKLAGPFALDPEKRVYFAIGSTEVPTGYDPAPVTDQSQLRKI